MSTILATIGAILLLTTAGYHLTGLSQVSADLEGERRGLTRAAWIAIAVDWLLLAVLWILTAFGALPPIVWPVTAVLPIGAAVVLAATLGLAFPGVWLLTISGACAVGAWTLM